MPAKNISLFEIYPLPCPLKIFLPPTAAIYVSPILLSERNNADSDGKPAKLQAGFCNWIPLTRVPRYIFQRGKLAGEKERVNDTKH